MTFYEKFQAHKGGLVRVNRIKTRPQLDGWVGKIGMICAVDPIVGTLSFDEPVTEFYAWVTLLIDENLREGFLYENEVEFLEGRQ